MEIVAKSCVCQSATKKFWVLAFKNIQNVTFPCRNDTKFATNLETQDYEALGFCQPPVMDQYYPIGLRLPGINTTNRRKCNSSSHPYFWRTRKIEDVHCVDGSPLNLLRNFNGDQRCNLASVSPGSLDQIYNATWVRCNSVQYSICQLERNASISKFCKNVSTTTAATTAATSTTAATNATATTALSNNSTAIIIGSILGVFAVLLFSWLLHFFRKRNNAKRNTSGNKNHEEVYYKYVSINFETQIFFYSANLLIAMQQY